MQKLLSFMFGVLIGTIVATAWAQYPNYPTVDSPRGGSAASMNPIDMMMDGQPLPVQQHDAI